MTAADHSWSGHHSLPRPDNRRPAPLPSKHQEALFKLSGACPILRTKPMLYMVTNRLKNGAKTPRSTQPMPNAGVGGRRTILARLVPMLLDGECGYEDHRLLQHIAPPI
jgi:hypothetical protein